MFSKTADRIVRAWLIIAVLSVCYAAVPRFRGAVNAAARDMWAAKKARDAKIAPCLRP